MADDAGVRPNLLVVLCDDLGFGDVGVLHQHDRPAGMPRLHTPHLDRMAAEGLVLEGLYCPAPVCAPSRASLLLGTTQGNADLRDNSFDRALEDRPTIATVLGAAGYASAVVGKWGLQGHAAGAEDPDADLGHPRHWPGYPTRRGFDEFYGYVRHVDGHEHYPADGLYRGRKQVWHDDQEVSAGLSGCYTTDLFTARTKQWIIDHRRTDPDRPFFVYLALDTPHAVTELPPCPYPTGGGLAGGVQWTGRAGEMITTAGGVPDGWCHPDYVDARLPDGRRWPDVYRRYATSVRRIDDAVGDLLRLLVDLGIDDSTLVLFTSDNGPSIESYLPEDLRADFFGSSGPFDGIKRDCWEGGVRVGGLVRAPGLVPAGRVAATPAQFHDLLPTFAELAGVAAPARTDGVSLVPLLTGRGEQPPSTVYVEYAGPSTTPDYQAFAADRRGRVRGQMQLVRLGDHVAVRYDVRSASDPFEIYDVVADPGQRHDLARHRPDLQRAAHREAARSRIPHPEFPRPYDDVPMPALGDADPVTPSRLATSRGRHTWPPRLVPENADDEVAVTDPARLPELPAGTTAAVLVGEVDLPQPGRWTFTVSGAAGAVLRVHRATVIDTVPGAGDGGAGTVRLAAGRHPYRLSLLHPGAASLVWRRSDAPVSAPSPGC